MNYAEKAEKSRIFRKLDRLLVNDEDLVEKIRNYFRINRFATPEHFRGKFSLVYHATDGNLNAVREYLGIPKLRLSFTRKRYGKCHPAARNLAKKSITTEDSDIQILPETPCAEEEILRKIQAYESPSAEIPEVVRGNLEEIAEHFTTKRKKSRDANSYDHIPKEIMNAVIETVAKRMSARIEDINSNTNIIRDLGANTLDEADLYFDLEDKFGIEIREYDEEPFTHRLETPGSLAEYIMNAQKRQKNKEKISKSKRAKEPAQNIEKLITSEPIASRETA